MGRGECVGGACDYDNDERLRLNAWRNSRINYRAYWTQQPYKRSKQIHF